MLTKIKIYLGIAIVFALTLLLAFVKGRSNGSESVLKDVAKTENDAIKEVAAKQVENIKVVKDVQKEVVVNSGKSVDDELLKDWTRS